MEGQQSKTSFCEWFNPDDTDHLHAYHTLQRTGMWPIDFIPERIWMEPGWQTILAFRLANRWIDYKLSDNNDGAYIEVPNTPIQRTDKAGG